MNNKWHLGSKAKSITVGTKLPPVTKVILTGKNNRVYTSGTDDGYVMEIDVPTATQQMADDLLKKAQGFEYQGYTANTAYVPPEVELGDGIETKGVYGILAKREYSFTPKITENVSAPYSSEEGHEFQYTGTYKKMLESKVEFDTSYGGLTIDKNFGISVGDYSGNLSMYQDRSTGQLVLTSGTDIDGAFQSSNTHGEIVQSLDRINREVRDLQFTDFNFLSEIRDAQGGISRLEQTTYGLSSEIKDAQGNISSLQQTATNLSSEIRSAQGDISRLEQTATSLTSQISDAQGNISVLQQTAASLRSDIQDAKGNISSLQQTATSLTSELRDAEGSISSLQITANSLSYQISDAKGNISSLQKTATSLSSSIKSAQGDISTINRTVSGLSSEISTARGNISKLEQTDKSLSSQISDAKGNISKLEQTTSSLSSSILSVKGDVSTLKQTATSLSSQIRDAKGSISNLQQTATGLSSSITSVKGDLSKVEQYAKSITLSVTNGKASSTIQLKAGYTSISSQEIKFTGMVTFNDLEGNGTTKINGANITTGKISADRIDVDSLKVNKIYAGSSLNTVVSTGSGTVYIGLGSGYKTNIQGTSVDITTSGQAYLSGTITKIGGSGSRVGFFGSSGSSKQAVSKVSTSATTAAIAGGLNNLITALKAYGLV